MKPVVTTKQYSARKYTNALYDLIEVEYTTATELLEELLCYLSEDQVKDFCEWSLLLRNDANECVIQEEDSEEEEE